jgi:hypothetical protein
LLRRAHPLEPRLIAYPLGVIAVEARQHPVYQVGGGAALGQPVIGPGAFGMPDDEIDVCEDALQLDIKISLYPREGGVQRFLPLDFLA